METTENPTIEFLEIKLGKKTYKLCYDFAAIAKAEKLTGMALLTGVDWANVGAERIRVMLYASALKAHPEATIEEFTPFIRPRYIRSIEAALATTWIASTDLDKEDGEDPQQPAAANA